MIRAVVFDVGECLVNEAREYGTWADWLGVPRHTFSAVFGSVISQGLDYRETFQVFRPGFDLTRERQARLEAGHPEHFDESDLYPDVRPALSALQEAGIWVGIAGNQTLRAGGILRSLDLPADLIVTSDDLGVEKPNAAFFVKIAELADLAHKEILYVGDRLDNDIAPAVAIGMHTALVRRGPWATIQWNSGLRDIAPTMRVDRLTDILAQVDRINSAPH